MVLLNEAEPAWRGRFRGDIEVGSAAHKELFCRMLLDTYDPYKPAVIPWPELDDETLARLRALPFWQVAVETEGYTSTRMQVLADSTDDPLIREAVSLNAAEERRHKDVLAHMIRFYGIPLAPEPDYPRPKDPEWAFMKAGYGECFDSFFAFGLFHLARKSGFFPAPLVQVFEPVIQEEARHILFFANWLGYTRANKGLAAKPLFMARRVGALATKIRDRAKLAAGMESKNSDIATMRHEQMGVSLSPGLFIDVCLAENDRRMARYDPRLLRPWIVPRLVRLIRPFVK